MTAAVGVTQLRAVCWSVLLLLCTFVSPALSAADIPSDLLRNVRRTAPFLEPRYQTPMTADVATLMTISAVLSMTGPKSDGERLSQIVQRRVLKRLLQEPDTVPGTVETALRDERWVSHDLEILRGRVLSQVVVQRVPSGGDAVGERDTRNIDLLATNHLADAVAAMSFQLVARKTQDPPRYSDLDCTPVAGVPIPPRGTATLTCSATRPVNTYEALRKDAVTPLVPFEIEFSRDGLVVGDRHTLPLGRKQPHVKEARRQVESAGCEELALCDDVAAWRARQASSHAWQQARLKRDLLVHRSFLVLTAVTAALLIVATYRRKAVKRDGDEWPDYFSKWVVGLSLLQLLMLYRLTESGSGMGNLGGIVWLFFLITPPQLLALLVLVGVLSFRSGDVGRLQFFALGLGVQAALSVALYAYLHR